jgi:uncharacterized protein YggE
MYITRIDSASFDKARGRYWCMPSATIAVKGSASEEYRADFGVIHFQHQFTTPARSEALTHGTEVIAQLRAVAADSNPGVREMKVRSLSVDESFRSVGPDRIPEPSGWSVQVVGETSVAAVSVPEIAATLTKVGVSINQITWHLESETGANAHRAVRRQAVADALEAAHDFAAALGGTVGALITLADPGLLSAGAFSGATRGRTEGQFFAAATSGGTPWDGRIDIDPSMITVSASVEASYVVNLD